MLRVVHFLLNDVTSVSYVYIVMAETVPPKKQKLCVESRPKPVDFLEPVIPHEYSLFNTSMSQQATLCQSVSVIVIMFTGAQRTRMPERDFLGDEATTFSK